ncbi:group II intron reverse transcriptase/maturase, partial [Herbivorax sp. ANBcel31]|uniref:group II intron reverse transcriptase/maturase n=1 Tax=Herbivorax sp. ANBcel31 TaxID=3069754 RepID=UPI0027B1B8BF
MEAKVNKLQSRIAKAASENRMNLVKKLQYLVSKSFYAKLLAVKRITSNKGKRTPGVDGEIWSSAESKYKGALSLNNYKYRATTLKRTYISKSNGKKRPLGIPTFRDRAMQALHLLCLDPLSEAIMDTSSFGFRKHRSTKDASQHLFNCLSTKNSAQWVLEGDIKGCFDNISHDWVQENIIMDKKILRQFLKSGYVYKRNLFPTKAGTPQGGIISPTLANLTLNGMATMLKKKYWTNRAGSIHRRYNKEKVHITVYADDFVITANSRETIEDIKKMIEDFLTERGLELSAKKTLITHIKKGFDFLGWNFRKHNDKLIIQPSAKSIKNITFKIKEVVRKNLMQKQEILIIRLNQIIRGWCNYHKHVCAKKAFQTIDKNIFGYLWLWAKRRHSMKSKGWRKNKYFTQSKTRDWIFK